MQLDRAAILVEEWLNRKDPIAEIRLTVRTWNQRQPGMHQWTLQEAKRFLEAVERDGELAALIAEYKRIRRENPYVVQKSRIQEIRRCLAALASYGRTL